MKLIELIHCDREAATDQVWSRRRVERSEEKLAHLSFSTAGGHQGCHSLGCAGQNGGWAVMPNEKVVKAFSLDKLFGVFRTYMSAFLPQSGNLGVLAPYLNYLQLVLRINI